MMLNRLDESLDKLNLEAAQQTQADAIVADIRIKLRALRDNNNEADPAAIRRRAREIFDDGLVQLRGVLSADQQTQLREMMRPPGGEDRPGGDRGPRDGPPRDGPPPAKDGGTGDGSMGDGGMGGPGMSGPATSDAPPKDNQDSPADGASASPAAGVKEGDRIFGDDHGSNALVEVGQAIPEFKLNRLDGKPFTTASLKGKPTVILFGSYTSPSFRQRAVQFQALSAEFSKTAQFVVIYTAEAHPKGQWEVERNTQEGVEVETHANIDARFAAARLARDQLKLDANLLPVVPDLMDDKFAARLGGFPNGLAVIDQDGKLYARQRWADVFATKAHLEALAKAK